MEWGLRWFDRYPERLGEEVTAMAARGFSLDEEQRNAKGRIAFTGVLEVLPEARVTVEYPEAFPSFPPRVCVVPIPEWVTRHVNPINGQLCLFGFDESEWRAELDGSAALDEAARLVTDVQVAAADDVVPEPATARYDYSLESGVLVPPHFTDLRDVQPGSHGTISWFGASTLRRRGYQSTRGVVTEIRVNGRRYTANGYFAGLAGRFAGSNAREKHGHIFWLHKPFPQIPGQSDVLEALRSTIPEFPLKGGTHTLCFVFPEEAGRRGTYQDGWLMLRGTIGSAWEFIRMYSFPPESQFERVPNLRHLASKRIAVVGVGSLGSRVAVHLAQAGVGELVLVDGAALSPGNLVRHECTIESLGMAKVDAVAVRVQAFNPRLQVLAHFHRVGEWLPDAKHQDFVRDLGSCDGIVDCTGSHRVSRYLNDLLFVAGVPIIVAWVTSGAWGGELVRLLKGKSGCYNCFATGTAPGGLAPWDAEGEMVFPAGCDQPTFTGAGFDVAEMASIASRAVVSTLSKESGYPDMPGDHIIWSNRNKDQWVGRIEARSILPRSECRLCGE